MTTARKLGLHEPVFAGNEWAYVKECLDTGWVSSAGKFVERFEAELAKRSGTKHAVAVVNGTAALDLALKLVGVTTGDEVITPSLTFIATVNAIAYQGATPLFVDVEEATFGLDPDALDVFLSRETEIRAGACVRRASGKRVAACVPMHALGHPVRLRELLKVCASRGIPVIEDAAEALGSTYDGRALGSLGLIGTLSFNGNKIATTGGGGALLTNDAEIARRAKHLSTQAKKDAAAFWHDSVGYNYRLPNVNAAIGCAQLEQLDGFVTRKRAIASRYKERFAGRGLRLVWEPTGARSNFWLNTVIAPDEEAQGRLLKALNDSDFASRPLWAPAHLQPMFSSCPRAPLPTTERLWRTSVSLPSSASLTDEDVDAVAAAACAVL